MYKNKKMYLKKLYKTCHFFNSIIGNIYFFPFKNIQGFKSHMPKLVHDNSEF